MTPADFRLYDFLDLAARAIDEAESGRRDFAAHAWQKAREAADALYPPGSDGDRAAGVVLLASRPDAASEGRALLWNALDAAAEAALAGMEGRPHGQEWLTAYLLASRLEPGTRAAMFDVLSDARRTALAGNEATA